VNARDTLTFLAARSKTFTSYLRNTALVSLFAAYTLSPRAARHPYLFYTSVLALASGSGVDFALAAQDKRQGGSGSRTSIAELNVERAEDLNGEQVRQVVEGMRYTEGVRAVVSGLAFAMGVVGIWGDGA
jgi:autophagy-related protein 33